MSHKKLQILTLSSGEAALPVLVRQLGEQTFQDFEHEVIAGLPNQAAHNRLYRTIAERAGSFDLFMKLDADMTLRGPASLASAMMAVDEHPEAQHFAFPVWDCFTEEQTLGVHVFRSGVSWGEITDDLFVDPDPAGVAQMLWKGPPAPFVNHGEVTSDFECFAFGVHKFLKAAQRGRSSDEHSRKAHKYFRHMTNCARIRDLCRSTHERRHQLALAGVTWAMDHDAVRAMSEKATLREVFESEILPRETHWLRRADAMANSLMMWRVALLRSFGLKRTIGAVSGAWKAYGFRTELPLRQDAGRDDHSL